MNKKYLRNIVTLSLSLLFVCGYYYFKQEPVLQEETVTSNNYQTVVFKDSSDTLIPVAVNLKCDDEAESNYREMMEVMKSSDYQHLGLYPIFSSSLELNNLIIDSEQLTFDFSNHLNVSNNQEALDIFEALSYTFLNDTIEKMILKIDGQEVSYLENSTIPVTCLTNHLGINNFQTSTNELYKTFGALVYNTKTIEGNEYFVPTTTRIEYNEGDLSSEVSLLLNEIDYSSKIETSEQCALEDGVLSVYLSSDILQDSETIDTKLYLQIMKSLESLQGVEQVSLYIDQIALDQGQDVSNLIDNRIQL